MTFTRRTRRFLLLLHILASVSWIGVDLAVGALSFAGLTTDDPRRMATAYGALSMFGVPLLLAVGLLSLTTGVLLGLGTRFGLVRYWWVLAKLVISVVLIALVPLALRPTLLEAATETAVVDPTLPDRLAQVRFNMIFPPVVSTSALVLASWLAVYKPWGPTARGRRLSRREPGRGTRGGRYDVPASTGAGAQQSSGNIWQ